MITHIEDQFSNHVLKKGSLFKFVYKLEQDDIWFSVEFKRQQEMRVHFIKTGVWCYTHDMEDERVYYARDVFNWDVKQEGADQTTRKNFMKNFYESFQGLAFSLLDEHLFFASNPKKYIYDLYVECFDAESVKRYKKKDFQIAKVMLVILSKEEKREDLDEPDLSYDLTNLNIAQEERKITLEFDFDDSQNDVYEKLKFKKQISAHVVEEIEKLLSEIDYANYGAAYDNLVKLINYMEQC